MHRQHLDLIKGRGKNELQLLRKGHTTSSNLIYLVSIFKLYSNQINTIVIEMSFDQYKSANYYYKCRPKMCDLTF